MEALSKVVLRGMKWLLRRGLGEDDDKVVVRSLLSKNLEIKVSN